MNRSKFRLLFCLPLLFACQLAGFLEPAPTAVQEVPDATIAIQSERAESDIVPISNEPLNGRSISLPEISYQQLSSYQPISVDIPAVVPLYTPSLDQVTNLALFNLSESELAQLDQNGIVLQTDRTDSLQGVYGLNLPAMLTADVIILHTHAVQWEVMNKVWLEFAERQTYDAINGLITESQQQLASAEDPLTKQAAQKNLAIFNLAGKFYDSTWPIAPEAAEGVQTEFALFQAEGEFLSPLLNKRVRYASILQDPLPAVRVYIWLMVASPQIDPAQSPAEQRLVGRQIELLTDIWSAERVPAWHHLYFQQQLRQGANSPTIEDWAALLATGASGDDLLISSRQFNEAKFEILPQPLTFSQSVFDELVFNRVGVLDSAEVVPITALNTDAGLIRATPRLIDLAAAFGSEAAQQALISAGEGSYAGWQPQLEALQADLARQGGQPFTQQQAFLRAIQPLAEPVNGSYPPYMRFAEQDALDQWSAAMVIASNPMFQRNGSPVQIASDQLIFVEPRPELYANLAGQTRQLAESLIALNMLDQPNADRLLVLEQDLLVLQSSAELALMGQRPTMEQQGVFREILTEASQIQMAEFMPLFNGPQGQLTARVEGWHPALFVILDGGQQWLVQGGRLRATLIRQTN